MSVEIPLANTAELVYEKVIKNSDIIRLTDKDEETGLELFCYNHCTNDDSDFVKKCRGIVFHNQKLVMSAYPYTDEYSHLDTSALQKQFTNFSEWTFFESHEGTLIRMFNFSGKWFLSTHRKLNAFRSKWSSKESFGNLFKKAIEVDLETFQNTLDKNRQYMFLLRNTLENRIVCMPDSKQPLVYHVGTFINGTLDLFDNVGLPKPTRLHFSNLDELVTYPVNPQKLQGVMCFGPNGKQLKVYDSVYYELFKVRGNVPSILFRYLQLRMDKDMVNKLYSLYPEKISMFEEYESTLYKIADFIYKAYVQRYIGHNFITVPKEEHMVSKACHMWHKSNPKKNQITLNKVISELNKQSPTNLNHMIRRYRMDVNKEHTHPRSYNNSVNNSPAILPLQAPL